MNNEWYPNYASLYSFPTIVIHILFNTLFNIELDLISSYLHTYNNPVCSILLWLYLYPPNVIYSSFIELLCVSGNRINSLNVCFNFLSHYTLISFESLFIFILGFIIHNLFK